MGLIWSYFKRVRSLRASMQRASPVTTGASDASLKIISDKFFRLCYN